MATPTSNPVPSKAPQDLLFNAEKVDEFVNSQAASFVNRQGAIRRTLAGIAAFAEEQIDGMVNTLLAGKAAQIDTRANGVLANCTAQAAAASDAAASAAASAAALQDALALIEAMQARIEALEEQAHA